MSNNKFTFITARANPQADTSAWEEEIDQLVYQLHGSMEEEVKMWKGKE